MAAIYLVITCPTRRSEVKWKLRSWKKLSLTRFSDFSSRSMIDPKKTKDFDLKIPSDKDDFSSKEEF